MKFAFSSNAFRRYDILETIKIVSASGYEGIEIMADVPHAFPLQMTKQKIRAILSTLDKEHIAVSNINAFMHHADGDTYHPTWIEREPALRAKRVDYTLRCIDLAAELGAQNISTEPGGPLEGMNRDEGMRLFREGLAAVEGKARSMGIRILIEPEPGLLIENSAQFEELFRELDPSVFGLNFDIGHFFCVGEDPSELVRQMQAVTHHYHLEDIASSREHFHLMLGKGAIDIPEVLRSVDSTGFLGFVTVELYTYEDDPVRAASEAIKYLDAWKSNRSPV